MKLRVCLLCWLTFTPLAMAQVYKLTDLGTLGGAYSEALSINALGQVVGESCVDSGCTKLHPFLWTQATGMQDLGTLPGGNRYAVATGVSLFGQVIGASAFKGSSGGETHAFLWTTANGMRDLGTLGCPDITGANGINLFGRVVGTSTIAPCGGGGQYRAFLWTADNGMQDIGTLPGGTFSFANAINSLGRIVGYSDCSSCNGYHAFLGDTAGIQDLGVLSGGSHSVATGLNDLGYVVGNSDSGQSAGQIHASLWTQENGMTDLGTLPGGKWSSASAVNEFGEVVGDSDSAGSATHTFALRKNGRPVGGASHAFLWRATTGMVDLNARIVAARSGVLLVDASAINIWGQIVGVATINGQTHAFLLTPVRHRHLR